MVCKNMEIYRFLSVPQVLLTTVPRNSSARHVIGELSMKTCDCGVSRRFLKVSLVRAHQGSKKSKLENTQMFSFIAPQPIVLWYFASGFAVDYGFTLKPQYCPLPPWYNTKLIQILELSMMSVIDLKTWRYSTALYLTYLTLYRYSRRFKPTICIAMQRAIFRFLLKIICNTSYYQ